jgi:hypothetical protein
MELTTEAAPRILSLAARDFWNVEYLKRLPGMIFTDDRPGAAETHMWWARNQGEVGFYLHGYQSAWLPASLLEKEKQESLADALFAATPL